MRMSMMPSEGMTMRRGKRAKKNKLAVHLDIPTILMIQINKCITNHQQHKPECDQLEHHFLMTKITTKHFLTIKINYQNSQFYRITNR